MYCALLVLISHPEELLQKLIFLVNPIKVHSSRITSLIILSVHILQLLLSLSKLSLNQYQADEYPINY